MATETTVHPTENSSSKVAEIHREHSGRIYYVCFHCGFHSDSITDTLNHIEIHFSSQTSVPNEEHLDFVNIKSEPHDEPRSHQLVTPIQLEQIFVDCGSKSILSKEQCSQFETVGDVTSDRMTLTVTDEYSPDLEGLFEWKCLHCQCLFKKCSKFEQHLQDLKKHKTDRALDRPTNFDKMEVHYTLRCTLCSAEFFDSHSCENHLKDSHPASPPIKCFSCCEKFESSELLRQHMSSCHEETERKSKIRVSSAEIVEFNKIPDEAKKKHSVCALCEKTFVGSIEFMKHTFGHFKLKIFSCSKCETNFQRSHALKDHMKKAHSLRDAPTFFCRFCKDNVNYSNELDFVTHVFKHHLNDDNRNSKDNFKCRDCDTTFDSQLHLMRHRLMHFNINPYSCSICCRSFSTRSNLTRHKVKDHDIKDDPCRQLICKFCQAEFTGDGEFIIHNFKNHLYENFNISENLDGRCKYECEYCGEETTKRDSMDEHLETHVNDVVPGTEGIIDETDSESTINELQHKVGFTYICLQCPLRFRLPTMAKKHVTHAHKFNNAEPVDDSSISMKVKASIEIRSNMHCHSCNETFKTWRSKVNHCARVHPETFVRTTKLYKKKVGQNQSTRKRERRTPDGNYCDVCNAAFVNNRSMINHRAKRHPEVVQTPEGRPKFTCPICGKTVRDRSNFNNHMETHKKLHSYTCDICSKTYRLKNTLKTHMLIHINEKNFICEECGKSFYTTSKLNFHKQVHENLTLHCDKCDKVFYTRNNFSKHKKTHMDKERKTCTVCGNTFKSSVSLRVHQHLHEDTKKYSCRYCDAAFSQSSGRRGHERAKHGFL